MKTMYKINSSLIDGYDLPVIGLGSWKFYALHIPALFCICISLCTNTLVMYRMSCRKSTKLQKNFFKWPKGERFLMYISLSDWLFNFSHVLDHLQILIVRDHVHPKALCAFYGFMLVLFISAQVLLSHVLAVNAFLLLYHQKKFNFGICDHRLLLFVYGFPLVGGVVAASFHQFGPSGAFCYFDGVTGQIANMSLAGIPSCIVLCINTILYVLIWHRLRLNQPDIIERKGEELKLINRSQIAAKKMSMFVLFYFIQWSVASIYGLWSLIEEPPTVLLNLGSIFPNLGGVYHMAIYFYIQKDTLSSSSSAASKNRKTSVYVSIQHCVNSTDENSAKANLISSLIEKRKKQRRHSAYV